MFQELGGVVKLWSWSEQMLSFNTALQNVIENGLWHDAESVDAIGGDLTCGDAGWHIDTITDTKFRILHEGVHWQYRLQHVPLRATYQRVGATFE